MEATGLVTAFNSSDLVATIFLPKNIAFENLLTSIGMTMDQALGSAGGAFTPFLGQILEYHVLPNVVLYAENFTNGEVLKTVIPDTLTVNTNPLTITSSADIKANVTFTNFIACKAIEHVLDTVLVPQSVVSAYTSSLNGGIGAPAPLVMATSGADVLPQVVAAAPAGSCWLQEATQVASELQALKDSKLAVLSPPAVLPTPPALPLPVSGAAAPLPAVLTPPPPPAVVLLPKKEALLLGVKDKISSLLFPSPPPAPIAVSGAPITQVPEMPAAGPVTALELPKVDVPLPLPKKKEILPLIQPVVPVYQFQLPDIKAELLALGKDTLSKLGLDQLIAQAPPPPMPVPGAVSGVTPAVAAPQAPPLSVLLPAKKDIPIIDSLKSLLLAQAPPPPATVPTAVSGTPATPATLVPTVVPLKKDEQLLADLAASLEASKKEAAAAPLVIPLNQFQGGTNLPDVESGNTYIPPDGYSSASASAQASASTGTVTAASGPEPQGVIVVGQNSAYNVTTSCSTVPAVAQMVPSMADFLSALQATGLDMALNNNTAMMTVFVPVNAAFDALALQMNQSLGAILAQTDMLKQVLEYHVVPGVSDMAANFTNGEVLQTAAPGETLTVQTSAAGVKVVGGNGVAANVIYPDVQACNAIIHVIDAVLSPAAAAPAPMPAMTAAAAVAPLAAALGPQPMPAAGGRH
ncbi:hypothetical protein WJX75_002403 [Coccomyxa subellipsoidea]